MLRVPLLRRVVFMPGVPGLIARVSMRLPRRPVRGPTSDLECDWEGCNTSYVANAARYYGTPPGSADVQRAVQEALGRTPVTGRRRKARAARGGSKK